MGVGVEGYSVQRAVQMLAGKQENAHIFMFKLDLGVDRARILN